MTRSGGFDHEFLHDARLGVTIRVRTDTRCARSAKDARRLCMAIALTLWLTPLSGRWVRAEETDRVRIPVCASWQQIDRLILGACGNCAHAEKNGGSKSVRKRNLWLEYLTGQSFGGSARFSVNKSLDPRGVLSWFEKDISHPTKVEIAEENGGKYTVYQCKDAFSDTTFYVTLSLGSAPNRPSRMFVKGVQTVNMEFKLIPYDVKAHETELFDTSNVKSYFSEYLPTNTAKPSATTPPKLIEEVDGEPRGLPINDTRLSLLKSRLSSPVQWWFRVGKLTLLVCAVSIGTPAFGEPPTTAVVVPNPAVWQTTNNEYPEIPVEIAVASGKKWRVETGNKEKVMIAVFDGKSVIRQLSV